MHSICTAEYILLPPGSTSTRNSSRRGSSEVGVEPKSRKELIMEKAREQLIKAKVFLLKK